MAKLLLKQVRPVGFPAGAIPAGADVAIDEQGRIAAVGHRLEPDEGAAVIDASSLLLSPGWIDLHVHVYYGVTNLGLHPEQIGPKTGVTVLADAGSAGVSNFIGFREYIAKPSRFPIHSFINIGSIGLTEASRVSDFDSLEKLELNRLAACIERNREFIKGVKIRASGTILRGWGVEAVKIAKALAEEMDLPLMVHIGEPLPLLADLLPVLGEGDIVTHCFHGKRWGIFNRKGLIPEAKEALERGVLFDIGHGAASFSYEVAERAVATGIRPFAISTDLHVRNINGPVWDLPVTMSKMLAVGMTVDEIIDCVTVRPASVLGEETYENGVVGKPARFTLFEVADKPLEASDSQGVKRVLPRIFQPKYAILGNEAVEAASRFGVIAEPPE